jgi:hypothetical protein
MVPDAMTFTLASHAEIVVSTKAVMFRWCDPKGLTHAENIERTAIGRLLVKHCDSQKPPRCAEDGTNYPVGFNSWTNVQRLNWLNEHSMVMAAHG